MLLLVMVVITYRNEKSASIEHQLMENLGTMLCALPFFGYILT